VKEPPENFPCFTAVRIDLIDSRGQQHVFAFPALWAVWALCRFLDLRRSDVERGTGVRAQKLCMAETKRADLNRPEAGSLRSFLLQRLADRAEQTESVAVVIPVSGLVN
jgi:hypothetical protein